MSQKVKIQDGIISYSAADPTLALDFNVAGTVNVWGINSPIDGVIASPDTTVLNSKRLDITTGTNSTLNIYENATGGSLYLNNVQWPAGTTQPHAGMFLGVSDINKLAYYPFILGNNSSDTLTASQLNSLYPTAQIGQSVIGPTVVYYSIGAGQWRILGGTSGGSSYTLPTASSSVLGGVKVGAGLSIDGAGVLSATAAGSTPYKTVLYTAPDTAPNQVIDTLDITIYRAVTYSITATAGSSYQYTEIRLLQDGVNVFISKINTIPDTSTLVSFTADISAGQLRLLSTPTIAGTVYNAVAVLVVV